MWRKEGAKIDLALPVNGFAKAAEGNGRHAAAEARAEKRVNPMKLKKLETRRKEMEEKVARLEGEIAAEEAALGNFVSVEDTLRRSAELDGKRRELAGAMAEWESVSERLEAVE